MTEKNWLARRFPIGMLKQALATGGERKARLLAAAYWECRAAWLTDSKNLRAACRRAAAIADGADPSRKNRGGSYIVTNGDAHETATTTLGILRRRDLAFPKDALTWYLHEVFGNPFRPVAVNPAWLTSTVVSLARGIYNDAAFDRLPILADALMDAGCDDESVLIHCRTETGWEVPKGAKLYSRPAGTHVRGCWVVDLLLGKE